MEPASSSSSFPILKQWIYDVFINFWGEEIERNFVSHLHSALLQAEVNTFLNGMEQGEGELVHAIEGSQIAIVVFTKSYAESTWCLEVLAKIIECHETYGLKVVPVFYEIDPSVVPSQEGDFGKVMEAAAKKRFSGKDLESALLRWTLALTKAANLDRDKMNHRNDAEVVEKIVDDVLIILHYPLPITKFPVGLESHLKDLIGFIENQRTKVCMIGIWGMGGSGKTTVAKAIYNRIYRSFMDKSFIEDIREVYESDRDWNIHLQEELLSNVLKTDVMIHDVENGAAMIINKLCRRKSLIVLDDVNKFDQLRHLCKNREWFGLGTVIIITTRDVRLLYTLDVDYVYKMKEMDENESLELFSWHAFGEAKPREDFNEFAKNVVAYCGGLPLALQVLGSCLFEQTEKEWKSVLSKLEIRPNDEVQEKLRISFDYLDAEMKDTFLDICCFFVGKDRDYVTEILNACELFATIGIEALIERSLIKLEKNNKLGIHPLLQEMGKEIIRENSPGKQSRMWFHKDVIDVLKEDTGTEAIEGLVLKLNVTNNDCFETSALEKMKYLRLLRLDHVHLTGDYKYLSKRLRWIYWKGFPLKHIPNDFYLKRVLVLELKHSNLTLVWKEPQVLPRLKILNLSHSKYLKETPDFSKLPNLGKIILKDCPSLSKIHKSIGDLRKLLLINVKDCTNLTNLPKELYKLKSVKTLNISGCTKIEKLEEDIVQMESLTTLIAENTRVKQVPFSIVRSRSIGYISLCGYEGLPDDVFPSIIWSWMSPTIDSLFCIHSFSSTSLSQVSIDMQNKHLGDLAPMISSLSNIQTVLVQCNTKVQVVELLRTHLVNSTELEITSNTSQISKHCLKSYLIGIGSYQEVVNNLSDSIPEGLETGESCDVSLKSDNHPHWLAHIGEGHSVSFTVPENCRIKGMTFCGVDIFTPEKKAAECLISVLVVNYTKCIIQICKRDTIISFNDNDWQGIMSHLESADNVEIFVIFGHRLVVKKTAVYLMCDRKMVTSLEPKKNSFVRFIKKFVTSKTQ